MANAAPGKKRGWIVGSVVAVALLVGGYFAWGALVPKKTEAEIILADVREMPVEKRFEKMGELRRQERDLPEEEREKLHEGMREMFMEEISKRIDEWEDAPEEEKVAVLDRHIDEFNEFRERMRKERERRRAEEGEDGGRGPRPDDGGPPRGDRAGGSDGSGGGNAAGAGGGGGQGARAEGRGGGRRGGRWGAPSIEQRKKHMEGTNPDRMVRMMRYFTKMRERAAERGVEMGGPGRGRGR